MMYSVIVPVYNAEATLRQCVDSILSQEFRNFELLLIDDGSKDLSPSICDDYAKQDARVKVYHKENGGVSSARNVGLNHAQGEWVAFVDSDDYVEQGYLSEIGCDNVDLIMCCFKDCYQLKNMKLVPHIYSRTVILEKDELRIFLNQNISNVLFRTPWAKFFRRELIDKQRFMVNMKVGEDACFVLNYLSKIEKLALIPNGAYVFMIDNTPSYIKYGMSVQYAAQSLENLCQAYKGVNEKFHIGTHGFISFIGSFKNMSRNDWMGEPLLWYGNSQISQTYDYVWLDLSLTQKIKLFFQRLYSKILS